MTKLHTRTFGLFRQFAAEFRLFWRSHQTIYLTFLVPVMGMALFVYLNREGLLESVFRALFRGMGQGEASLRDVSPMTLRDTNRKNITPPHRITL